MSHRAPSKKESTLKKGAKSQNLVSLSVNAQRGG